MSAPDAIDRLVDELERRREARTYRRAWAAVMLTPHVDVCESVLLGKPVPRRRLNVAALRRAYRGRPIPTDDWLTVTPDMLDAIAEGGAFGVSQAGALRE